MSGGCTNTPRLRWMGLYQHTEVRGGEGWYQHTEVRGSLVGGGHGGAVCLETVQTGIRGQLKGGGL